ncbi:hypothetical protein BSL82_02920 [Tardibacter chloracetimidivorans]|uniref:SWFGD domain-containing protein n=1 Tax=Tardibacter chloracetimidivorans TaxID=1921510 RepID=A0A1L3ZRX7_9SPHN|nr:DUF2171 domain-containing protein [Tardibacter chloracetimidivorans]API58386.1 hypothetical protein BSL82_02920 [Tardibacter chloracetimidivorans]
MAYDRYGRDRYSTRESSYGRSTEDYDYDDRGFFDRAGDEVRSWFGDDEAERRRRRDARYDEQGSDDQGRTSGGGGYRPAYGGDRDREGSSRYASSARSGYGYDNDYGMGSYGERQEYYGQRSTPRQYAGSGFSERGGRGGGRGRGGGGRMSHQGDSDYHQWRNRQIEALDREYDDYRRERQSRFESDFGGWRQQRATQRQHLTQARENMEVVGSDGEHVGKVDKVRGDRIKLAKNDEDAGGRHHYVPCSWIQSVESNKVTLNRTADQAHREWQAEREDSSGNLTSSSF